MSNLLHQRVSTLCFNVGNLPPETVVSRLAERNIVVRSAGRPHVLAPLDETTGSLARTRGGAGLACSLQHARRGWKIRERTGGNRQASL